MIDNLNKQKLAEEEITVVQGGATSSSKINLYIKCRICKMIFPVTTHEQGLEMMRKHTEETGHTSFDNSNR